MRSERLKSQILVGKSGNFINYRKNVYTIHGFEYQVQEIVEYGHKTMSLEIRTLTILIIYAIPLS